MGKELGGREGQGGVGGVGGGEGVGRGGGGDSGRSEVRGFCYHFGDIGTHLLSLPPPRTAPRRFDCHDNLCFVLVFFSF